MPPGVEALFSYGALGVFSAFTLIVLWKSGHALWSVFLAKDDDPAKQGYFVRKMEAALRKEEAEIERERKQAQFIDVLIGTEARRSDLCEQHNRNLMQIGTSLAEHHVFAKAIGDDISAFRDAAMVMSTMFREITAKKWPEHLEDVNRCCDEFEKTIKRM